MSPGQIERYAQERSITIISNLYQKPLAEAFREAYAAVAAQRGCRRSTAFATGRGKLLQEALANFLIAFVLSLAFIYIVPRRAVRVVRAPAHHHGLDVHRHPLRPPHPRRRSTLNIYSIMGLFLLMGVVKKNASSRWTTPTSCASGHGAQPGPDGGRSRAARPILMTTFAIIAGMLPVALGSGDGSASRASLAKVVVGGQGTLSRRHAADDAGHLLDVRRYARMRASRASASRAGRSCAR